MSEPAFDSLEAHQHFSKHCFNRAWDLIDKSQRTPEDNEQLIHLAHASLWHWSERPDCTGKNLSIGYWQLSRIYALAGEGASALKYAQICLEKTPEEDSFLLGYAHEALARAEKIQGNEAKAKDHLSEALRLAETIDDAESQQMLLNDLNRLF
jgi:tetratricopeptide (TPR) repeat protein